MNKIELTTLCFVASCITSSAQVSLNAGETYSYEFTTLPLFQTVTGFPPLGGEFGTVSSGDGRNYRWRLDMFENSTSDAPLASMEFGSGTGATGPWSIRNGVGSSGAWQDLQGAVQFTVLAGTVRLDSMIFTVTTPGERPDPNLPPINYYVYQAAIPAAVPEPTTLGLLGLIVFVGLGWQTAIERKQK